MSLPAPALPETAAAPDLWRRIEARLGTGPVRSEHDLARLVEARLPVQAATALLAHGLRDAELDALVLPRRTLAHRRARGDAWRTAGRTARLDVPSALVPETWNILLDPAHPDAARARLVRVGEHPLDARPSARLSAG